MLAQTWTVVVRYANFQGSYYAEQDLKNADPAWPFKVASSVHNLLPLILSLAPISLQRKAISISSPQKKWQAWTLQMGQMEKSRSQYQVTVFSVISVKKSRRKECQFVDGSTFFPPFGSYCISALACFVWSNVKPWAFDSNLWAEKKNSVTRKCTMKIAAATALMYHGENEKLSLDYETRTTESTKVLRREGIKGNTISKTSKWTKQDYW